jgi:hypothetical protein
MNVRPSSYFVIATLIFGIGIIIYSLTYPYLESKLLPIIIAGVLLILAAIQLGKELRADGRNGGEAAPEEEAKSYPLVKGAPSAAWIIGFCLGLYLLGFLVAVPLFVFSYMKSRGRGWAVSVIVPVILTACIYLIFTTFLQVRLSSGLLFDVLS